jgi:hypothetical protein
MEYLSSRRTVWVHVRRALAAGTIDLPNIANTHPQVDEAFKSRIQLSLHYENLGPIQRRKIWRNFMNRIKTLEVDEGGTTTDVEDILYNIEELSKEAMNGREIRNAITIARQLAQFKNERFGYSHLQHVIKVGGKFGKYLEDLREGFTDDDIKKESQLRLSYALGCK